MTVIFNIRNSAFGICPARRLALINLALRGNEADFGPKHTDNLRRVLHPDLRADYVLANPPFNDSNTELRGRAFLQSAAKPQVVSEAKDNFRKDDDVRWQFGVPPKGKANFAWVQHFIPTTSRRRAFW
jgi:type I restriction enzyme M protein